MFLLPAAKDPPPRSFHQPSPERKQETAMWGFATPTYCPGSGRRGAGCGRANHGGKRKRKKKEEKNKEKEKNFTPVVYSLSEIIAFGASWGKSLRRGVS